MFFHQGDRFRHSVVVSIVRIIGTSIARICVVFSEPLATSPIKKSNLVATSVRSIVDPAEDYLIADPLKVLDIFWIYGLSDSK